MVACMTEGQPSSSNHAERSYPQQPFSSFAETLQRRYTDLITYGYPTIPAEDMLGLLGSMNYDAWLTDNTTIQEAAQNMKWAFIALTYPNYSPAFQTYCVMEYNQLQEERREQGKSTTVIEVPVEQTYLLHWMLDQIEVAHGFQDGDITIPFAPLEEKMREVAQKAGSQQFYFTDHEERIDVGELMEHWEKQQGKE